MFDFIKRMIELLPQYLGRYKTDSAIYKILEAYSLELTQLKDTFDAIEQQKDIDQAFGVHLDRIARDLNVDRGSMTDEELRATIKVEILANKSTGNISTIREVAEVVLNNPVGLRETHNDPDYANEPAGLILQIVGDVNDIQLPQPTIEKAVAGGVRLVTELKISDEIIEIQEPDGRVVEVINLRSGTFVIAQVMGQSL